MSSTVVPAQHPCAFFPCRAASRPTAVSTLCPAYRVTMLDTAPVLPCQGARIVNDRPCVRVVRTLKGATWSDPMRCQAEVQTFCFPFTACWSWMEQRSQPVTWMCRLVFAGF